MRDLRTLSLERLPNKIRLGNNIVTYEAVFKVKTPYTKGFLVVVCSTGHGWDHVSISHEKRVPTWNEMEYIKRLMFEDHEVAMQLHVPPKDHINIHPNVLHLWRPQDQDIPMPPKELV